MKRYSTYRPAIAMVELIFAIVVMAFVLMSAPNLIAQSTKSSYVGLQQESINAAASHINIIMTKEWDQGNADPTVDPRVLQVAGGEMTLAPLTATNARAGTPPTSFRMSRTGKGQTIPASSSSTFGETGDDSIPNSKKLDDVDDYDDKVTRLSQKATSNDYNANYKDLDIKMTTKVSYVRDGRSGLNYNTATTIDFHNPFSPDESASTNIKAISVLLETDNTEDALSKEITLSAFMCNIGHYRLDAREMP